MSQIKLKKFYVQSGKVNWVVLASDANDAALRAVQKALQDSLLDSQEMTHEMKLVDKGKFEQLTRLFDKQISVSEAGFNRDANDFVARDTIKEWIQQIKSLQSMIRRMAE